MISGLHAILLDLSGDKRPLAALLRNPAVTLGMGVRTYLADVHEGLIIKPRHRPRRAAPLVRGENFKLTCAVLLLSEGKHVKLTAAVHEVADANECNVSKVWAALKFTKDALGEKGWKQVNKLARKGKPFI